jgi:hypothetical protein
MSFGETYSIAVRGAEDGLAIAGRLASNTQALLRWAGLWTARSLSVQLATRLSSHAVSEADWTGYAMLCVPNPTLDDVRCLIAYAENDPLMIHWSQAIYTCDDGPDRLLWISFVDAYGRKRDDAVVYSLELAYNAAPFTAGDRPWDPYLNLGPALAVGWALHVSIIRDHMPEAELRAWLAAATCVPIECIKNVSDGGDGIE